MISSKTTLKIFFRFCVGCVAALASLWLLKGYLFGSTDGRVLLGWAGFIFGICYPSAAIFYPIGVAIVILAPVLFVAVQRPPETIAGMALAYIPLFLPAATIGSLIGWGIRKGFELARRKIRKNIGAPMPEGQK